MSKHFLSAVFASRFLNPFYSLKLLTLNYMQSEMRRSQVESQTAVANFGISLRCH